MTGQTDKTGQTTVRWG